MNKDEIVKLIKHRIEEHKLELAGSELFKQKVQKSIDEIKGDLTNKKEDAILKMKNLFGVSEKLKFHKTCVDVLNDLLKDIEA